MALIPALLARGLAEAFARTQGTAAEASQRQAASYAAYARAAMAGAFPWVPTGAEEARLRLRLLAAMTPTGAPDQLALAWSSGLLAFWMAPPVIFGAGLVTVFPGQVPLVTSLVPLFSNPRNPATMAASSLASALDIATRTVIVTLPIIGPVPLL